MQSNPRSLYSRLVFALTATVGLFGLALLSIRTAPIAIAATGTNPQINYQGRLLTNTGAVVPDGNYNMRFKIYQDGAGTAAGDPGGTLKWTESWQNIIGTGSTGPVVVKNGYFSVNLGKWCAFTTGSCQGNSNTVVDWNQDTLWLSVDVDSAGTSVNNTPTYNGEMLPMKRFTSSIYAFNASQLGGLGATNFVQLAQGLQTDASTTQASIAINKTGGTAAIVDLQRGGTSVFNIDNAGATTITGPAAGSSTALTVNTGSGYNAGLVVSSAGQNYDYSYITAWNTTLGRGVFDVNYLGNTTLRNATDNAYALTVRNQNNFSLIQVDTLDANVAIANANLCVSPYGISAASCTSQLTVQNSQRFITGYGGGPQATYTTPLGASIEGRIIFDNDSIGSFKSLITGGLSSLSDATARGIVLADARSAGDNQQVIGVLSPNETDIFGLGWDGVNTAGTLKTLSKQFSSTGGINLFTGAITVGGSSNATGDITIKSGNAVVNNNTGGIFLETGNVSGSGTGGQVLAKPGTGANRSDFFQIQDAAGTSVLTVDTSSGKTAFGKAGTGGLNGKIVFNTTNASNYASSIAASASQAANIDYTLPTAIATTGQCLQAGTVAAPSVPLVFGSCGSGGTLQTAFDAAVSPATVSEILVGGTNATGLDVQNKTGTLSGANIFDVLSSTATNVIAGSSVLFGVSDTGKSTFQSTTTSNKTLGSELASGNFGAGWTTTGWTLSGGNTIATHNSGNTNSLINTGLSLTAGATYQISLGILNGAACGTSSDTITVYIGGTNIGSANGLTCSAQTLQFVGTAGTTTGLTLTPSSSYTGAFQTISIKQLTGAYTPTLVINNSGGTSNLEVRTSTDISNTYIGLASGSQYAVGYNNTALGTYALQSSVTTYNSTAIGYGALQANVTGQGNTAVGTQTLTSNLTGQNNSALGYGALSANTSGSNNVGIGNGALGNNTVGVGNTALGVQALLSNVTGQSNVAVGQASLSANVDGQNNIAVGANALISNVSGYNNVGLGYNSLYGVNSNNNIGIGYYGGYQDSNGFFATPSNITGSSAIGAFAQVQSNNSIVLGSVDTTTNVGIGTTVPSNLLSVSPLDYQSGTVIRTASSTALAGTGTTWTTAMAGDQIIFADGQTATVASVTNATTIVMNAVWGGSTDGSGVHYRLHRVGLQVSSTGNVGIGTASPTANLQLTTPVNTTTAFQIQNNAGAAVLNVDTTTNTLSVRQAIDNATIGSELIISQAFNNATYWTCGAGWTTGASSATHTLAGGTNTCTTVAPANYVTPIVAGAKYQVTFTIAGNTTVTETVKPKLGGVNGIALGVNGTYTQYIPASSTAPLLFTPTNNFNGVISNISVKLITQSSTSLTVKDSTNALALEVRSTTSSSYNTFVGISSGANNTSSGTYNTAFGVRTLESNISGTANTALGVYGLNSNTTGTNNTALGYSTLTGNINGTYNTAIGDSALANNISGSFNIGIGPSALGQNLSGTANIAIGFQAVGSNSTASSSIGIGYQSLAASNGAKNIALGSSSGYQSSDSFLQPTTVTNAVTIGNNAVSTINNSLILGGGGPTDAVNVGIGTSAPNNTFSVSPYYYSSGATTASQSTNTVTAGSSVFTAAMIGMQLIFNDGTNAGTITAQGGTTATVTSSQTVSPAKAFRVYTQGFNVTSAGNAYLQNTSTTAFRVQNTAGTSLLTADTTNGQVIIGTASTMNGNLIFANNSNANTVSFLSGATSGNYALTLPLTGASSTNCLQSTAGSTTSATTLIFASCTGTSSTLQGDYTLSVGGSTSEIIADATRGALDIQDRSTSNGGTIGANLLNVRGTAANDSTAGALLFSVGTGSTNIGSPTTDGTQINLQLDSFNTLADTGTCTTSSNQGAIYYNTASGAIRSCVNGTWDDVVTTSGLGLLAFGIVPDSAATTGTGDLEGANGYNSGPCKAYLSAASTVSWNSCTAYSIGRKFIVAAGSVGTSASTGVFQNLCLNTSGVPTLIGTANATETTSTLYPTFSTSAPVLCLATIKTGTTASTVAAIYDLRFYTTSTKQFATLATTGVLGGLVKNNGTIGQYMPVAAITDQIQGVLVTYSGTVSTTVPNAVIVTAGPVAVKATAGTIGQAIKFSSATGYGLGAAIATTAVNPYVYAGIAHNTYSGSATSCTASTVCNGSLFTILNIK